MGYLVYGHGGSGDHGCEDRLRGLCAMLPEEPEVYSVCPEEDWRYGIGTVAGLYRGTPGAVKPGDWCVGTHPGGTLRFRRQGGRPVLWGWSVGERTLTRPMLRQLSRYEAVAVTEGRSLHRLRHAGLEKNLRLTPEPAFLVERRLRPLRGAFRSDTVGLCLGAWLCGYEEREGLLYRSYCSLIRWILRETRFQIALIPYCVKPGWDDGAFLKALELRFRDSGRVFCREDGDCRTLRGDLSLCRCCVGSAGVVAGWSCGVPGLCVGASPRGMGLSQDLFGSWEEGVVPVSSLKTEEDLICRFRAFLRRENTHRRHLETQIPIRRQQAKEWKWESLTV